MSRAGEQHYIVSSNDSLANQKLVLSSPDLLQPIIPQYFFIKTYHRYLSNLTDEMFPPDESALPSQLTPSVQDLTQEAHEVVVHILTHYVSLKGTHTDSLCLTKR